MKKGLILLVFLFLCVHFLFATGVDPNDLRYVYEEENPTIRNMAGSVGIIMKKDLIKFENGKWYPVYNSTFSENMNIRNGYPLCENEKNANDPHLFYQERLDINAAGSCLSTCNGFLLADNDNKKYFITPKHCIVYDDASCVDSYIIFNFQKDENGIINNSEENVYQCKSIRHIGVSPVGKTDDFDPKKGQEKSFSYVIMELFPDINIEAFKIKVVDDISIGDAVYSIDHAFNSTTLISGGYRGNNNNNRPYAQVKNFDAWMLKNTNDWISLGFYTDADASLGSLGAPIISADDYKVMGMLVRVATTSKEENNRYGYCTGIFGHIPVYHWGFKKKHDIESDKV